ncbi:MAG TPA: hypothetical protein VGD21_04120 [Lysobacter sp.]
MNDTNTATATDPCLTPGAQPGVTGEMIRGLSPEEQDQAMARLARHAVRVREQVVRHMELEGRVHAAFDEVNELRQTTDRLRLKSEAQSI